MSYNLRNMSGHFVPDRVRVHSIRYSIRRSERGAHERGACVCVCPFLTAGARLAGKSQIRDPTNGAILFSTNPQLIACSIRYSLVSVPNPRAHLWSTAFFCVFERRSAAPPPLRSFVYNSVELKYDVFMCMTKELAL